MKRGTSGKRNFVRTRLRAAVTLHHPDTGVLHLHTEDISDGGAYLLTDGQALPRIGELVEVQVQGLPGGDAPIVTMKIIRIDAEGIGLSFVDSDQSSPHV